MPAAPPPTERVVIFVGQVACAEVHFASDSPPSAMLGSDDQPAACSVDGAEVTFLQFRSPDQQLELYERTTFAAGTVFEFVNWAPQPPGSMLPSYMQAFLDAGAVVRPATTGNAGLKPIPGSTSVATVGLLLTVLLIAVDRRLTAAHRGRE